ncbi:MAG: hypothetical protein IJW60_02160 [Clostridia bacterium]|nr:hypothetical protein [Clostridia bacterium]
MKKLKTFIYLLAASVLTTLVMLAAACGGSKGAAYTLLVKDESGNALSGVLVGICSYDETTGEKSNCLTPATTDENGKVVLEADEGTYTVNEDTLGNYSCKETYVLKAYGEYTIVLVTD